LNPTPIQGMSNPTFISWEAKDDFYPALVHTAQVHTADMPPWDGWINLTVDNCLRWGWFYINNQQLLEGNKTYELYFMVSDEFDQTSKSWEVFNDRKFYFKVVTP